MGTTLPRVWEELLVTTCNVRMSWDLFLKELPEIVSSQEDAL